jgi:hypothetical protein
MNYKSPIPVLQYAGSTQDKPDANDLLKIQKRLLVELEHSGGTLKVGEQSLYKDEILTMIDDLKQENSFLFHQWIAANPALLALIERGVLPTSGPLINPILKQRPEFAQFKVFITPYLVQPVSKGINQVFLKHSFVAARRYLSIQYLLDKSHFDELFGKLRQSLQAMADDIKRTEKKEIAFAPGNFNFVNGDFVDFLNELPEGLANFREVFAVSLINISVDAQHQHADFCQRIYSYLQVLNCSEATKKVIQQNRSVFNRDEEQEVGSDGGSNSGWGVVGGVFFFLLAMVRMCVRLSDDDYSYTGPKHPEPAANIEYACQTTALPTAISAVEVKLQAQ